MKNYVLDLYMNSPLDFLRLMNFFCEHGYYYYHPPSRRKGRCEPSGKSNRTGGAEGLKKPVRQGNVLRSHKENGHKKGHPEAYRYYGSRFLYNIGGKAPAEYHCFVPVPYIGYSIQEYGEKSDGLYSACRSHGRTADEHEKISEGAGAFP